jgi:polysaccharide export outer membrane protein
MPLIGQIKADGETVDSLTRIVRNRLGATVFECPPEVNIQVLRNNSKKYYIYGGVLKQGEFPLNGPMTVLDAFANCGGFKDFANQKKIYILRGDQKLKFNYKEVSQGKNKAQNIALRNGDRIFVPE